MVALILISRSELIRSCHFPFPILTGLEVTVVNVRCILLFMLISLINFSFPLSINQEPMGSCNKLIIIFAYFANVRIWLILRPKMSCCSHVRVFWMVTLVVEGGCGGAEGGGGGVMVSLPTVVGYRYAMRQEKTYQIIEGLPKIAFTSSPARASRSFPSRPRSGFALVSTLPMSSLFSRSPKRVCGGGRFQIDP